MKKLLFIAAFAVITFSVSAPALSGNLGGNLISPNAEWEHTPPH